MRRTLNDTLLALREQLRAWSSGQAPRDLRVLVYAPEYEAEMLARLPEFAAECAAAGLPVEVINVGQRFLAQLESRPIRMQALRKDDAAGKPSVLGDLGTIASRLVDSLITAERVPPATCRLLSNTGSLATLISYSAIANRLYDATQTPVALLFPGEGDDRALNILGLRSDPTYRVPRI
jgi:hypothetical protein